MTVPDLMCYLPINRINKLSELRLATNTDSPSPEVQELLRRIAAEFDVSFSVIVSNFCCHSFLPTCAPRRTRRKICASFVLPIPRTVSFYRADITTHACHVLKFYLSALSVGV